MEAGEVRDPLDQLSEKEAEVMAGVLAIIEAVIEDDELRTSLVGTLLVEIEEWGTKKAKPN